MGTLLPPTSRHRICLAPTRTPLWALKKKPSVVLLCHHGCGSRSPASGAHAAEASVALAALHYELAVALHIAFLRFSGLPLCRNLLEMATKSGYTRQCPLDIRSLRGGRWSPGCLRQRRTHHRPVPRAAAWDGATRTCWWRLLGGCPADGRITTAGCGGRRRSCGRPIWSVWIRLEQV